MFWMRAREPWALALLRRLVIGWEVFGKCCSLEIGLPPNRDMSTMQCCIVISRSSCSFCLRHAHCSASEISLHHYLAALWQSERQRHRKSDQNKKARLFENKTEDFEGESAAFSSAFLRLLFLHSRKNRVTNAVRHISNWMNRGRAFTRWSKSKYKYDRFIRN